MIAETKTHVSIAPFTASRLASGLPYLGDLLKRGVQCSLSVDTTTVGGNADMFSIMRLMLQLNHLRSMDVMEVQPRRILELATIDGARDLGIADRVGSLTPGKRADLILVRTNDLNVAPFFNPALLLVQQAQPYNVDTVIIDGRILKHKGELTALDAEEVIRQSHRIICCREQTRRRASFGTGIGFAINRSMSYEAKLTFDMVTSLPVDPRSIVSGVLL